MDRGGVGHDTGSEVVEGKERDLICGFPCRGNNWKRDIHVKISP